MLSKTQGNDDLPSASVVACHGYPENAPQCHVNAIFLKNAKKAILE